MSCPYKYALGIPGEGFHAMRLGPIALGDTLGTVALAVLTAWLTNSSIFWNFVVWFVVGEILHYAFGTPTAFLKLIGLTPSC